MCITAGCVVTDLPSSNRVGVTTQDRPVAAPQTGDFDLGYHAIANPTFVAAITSVATIFCSGAGTSAFLPVISEMKKPRDYNKAVYLCSKP